MIDKLKNWWQSLAKTFTEQDSVSVTEDEVLAEGAESSKSAKRKQDLIIIGALSVVLVGALVWNEFTNYQANTKHQEEKAAAPLKLEVASSALDPDKMWRNLFEDKLTISKEETDKKLELIETSINEASLNYQNQLKAEVDKLKAQLQYLIDEQESSKRDLSNIKLKSERDEEYKATSAPVQESHIEVNHMGRGEVFDRPKSSRNFIPEGVYVKGVLLGGIVVSTSMGSSAEPVPVVIRVTDSGNLPKNFNMDLSKCKIIGSSYGDLSSERAIIRAETLTCNDEASELIYTTKVAGLIYGDDGMNGIKGRVVQTSNKHLKNAIVGGMISGFASSAKGQDPMFITGSGAVNTKKKGFADMATEGAFSGASNAAEKIADYYIKQAESMSPVLLISGGAKVDMLFTKGVYFGALDIQEKLDKARKEKGAK